MCVQHQTSTFGIDYEGIECKLFLYVERCGQVQCIESNAKKKIILPFFYISILVFENAPMRMCMDNEPIYRYSAYSYLNF